MALRYPSREPFIANTDRAWFDFLSSKAVDGRVDEVNFWLSKATTPMKQLHPGEPLFFRLKKPDYAIAGYGFFAHFEVVDLHTTWSAFGWKNGDPDKRRFFERIGGYRGIDLLRPGAVVAPLGCTILRDAIFWPPSRWLPWNAAEGWAQNIVQGKTERDEHRARRLADAILADARRVPDDLAERFVPLDVDERELVLREIADREGQGAFRLRLMRAYDGQCAITGEHTAPVLDAAHIQPYLGPRSNHVQNGLLLTKEFHALFDEGYVAVTPDYDGAQALRHADLTGGTEGGTTRTTGNGCFACRTTRGKGRAAMRSRGTWSTCSRRPGDESHSAASREQLAWFMTARASPDFAFRTQPLRGAADVER